MAIPTFQLRTVTSGGALDKFLPDFESLSLSSVFCKAGTVVIKYPESGVNFNLLDDDVEIAVILNGSEITSMRCIIESTEGNEADEAEDGAIWTFTARTMLGLLDRAVVYPEAWPVTNPPLHDFVNTNVGNALHTLLTRAQSRGALNGLTWDFTTTNDSSGWIWTDNTLDLSYDAGMKYSDVLENMVDSGLVEIRMEGRMLKAYRPGTLGTDRSTGANPLRFTKARDLKEAPRKTSTRELATVALIAGDANLYGERVSDLGTLFAWGRRETSYSQQNIKTSAMITTVGNWLLDTVNRPLHELTHSLFLDNDDNPTPVIDFTTGDWGLSDVGKGWESYRIRQWTIGVENDGTVTGSVVLNDLIDERIERLNRKLAALTNGTQGAGGSEQKDDKKAPATPTGVTLSTDYYVVGNIARAILTADWSPVTTNSDGTPMSDLDRYRVRWKYGSDSIWRTTQTVQSDTTVAFFDNINTGTTVHAQVQAVDQYNRASAWSSSAIGSTATDTAAPARPSSPVVSSNVGTLRLVWDGLDFSSNPMAADLSGVEVHVGPSGSFTPGPGTLKDFIRGSAPTAVTITGLTYGQEYWIRLVAVDTSGNKSAGSDETSTSHAVLTQVVSVEIGTGQVGLNNTRFSDVGNLVDDGNFELDFMRTTRTTAMAGQFLFFDNTTASNGTWSIRSDSGSGNPTDKVLLQGDLPIKPGERVFAAADYKLTATATGLSGIALRWKDKDGAYRDSAGAVDSNAYYFASSDVFVTQDNTWYKRVTTVSQVAPINAVTMEVWLFAQTRTVGTVWIDSVEIRKQIDTLLIADAAITSAKIGSLQVNDAHMANVSIGKLTAGSLTADMTVSARIKTANTGARAEMSSAGFEAYNSGGTKTFSASSAGVVSMLGELKSGVTGKRVEINPGNSGLPEIRFYPGTGSNYGYINAFGDAGSVSMGFNSGLFTIASESAFNRIYMGEDFFKSEVVKADQTSWGGYTSLQYGQAAIGRNTGSSTDCHLTFGSDGKIRFQGEMDYFGTNDNAILMGAASFTGGPYGGAGASYGATQASTPLPVATLYDNDSVAGSGIGLSLNSRTTTGWDCAFTRTGAGSDGSLYFWAWRP